MRKLAVVLAVLALIAAGCGDRGSDASGGTGGGDPTTTAAGGDDGGGGGGAGDFGDLEAVCGPNEGGGAVPEGDDSQGVSEDEIVLGTVADPGFQGRPGLNQELFDSGKAFVQWCNEQGGINGKTIVLNEHDAALTEYGPVIEEACGTDFALVGGGAVQDNLWEETGAACDLVDIAGFAVTSVKAGLAGDSPDERRTVQPLPNPGDRYPVGAAKLVLDEYPDAAENGAFLYSDFETIVEQKNKEEQGLESIGVTFGDPQVYNINGEDNWKPFATALEQDGVQFMKFIGEPTNAGNLLAAMDQVGYQPEVRFFETNFYDQSLLDAAGPGAEGIYVSSAFAPLEEADDNPATAQYLELIEAVDGKVSVLGLQSMSAWLLFATLAKTCDQDDNLTRTCLLEEAANVTEWTGGGLHAPSNPSENLGSECQMVMTVTDGKFERWAPDEGFSCDPSNIATVEPPQ